MSQWTPFILGCLVLCAAARADPPMNRYQAQSAWAAEGLQPIEAQGLDLVYARPGADLWAYRKVLLRPVSVSFMRDWEKQSSAGTRARVSAADAQRTRDRVAALVHDEVVKELDAGGYDCVDGVGEDVLELDLSIVNLQVNSPDVTAPGRAATYGVSTGEMTLLAGLRNAATVEVVVRAFDRWRARESAFAQPITSVDNAFDARAAAARWARALRGVLDVARQARARP